MSLSIEEEISLLKESIDFLHISRATFSILIMQSGFALLESGMIQLKNSTNILLKNVIDVSVTGLVYWLIGHAFAAGNSFGGIIGLSGFANIPMEELANWGFAFAFASTTTTIISGATAERMNLNYYIGVSFTVPIFLYSPISHWVWHPNGWLNSLGFYDFAGGTVVHFIGGLCGLLLSSFLGPRIGRFAIASDGSNTSPPAAGRGNNESVNPLNQTSKYTEQYLPMSSPTQALLGTLTLWWGWYSFNTGSTYRFTDSYHLLSNHVAVVTTLAACVGSIVGFILSYHNLSPGLYNPRIIVSAILTSLASITPCATVVSQRDAVIISALATTACAYIPKLLYLMKIDDPVDAVAVHAGGGLAGTISIGFFAQPIADSFGIVDGPSIRGLFYGGGVSQLGVQLLGCILISLYVYIVIKILTWLPFLQGWRVNPFVEKIGADYAEHGVVGIETMELLRSGKRWTSDDIEAIIARRTAVMVLEATDLLSPEDIFTLTESHKKWIDKHRAELRISKFSRLGLRGWQAGLKDSLSTNSKQPATLRSNAFRHRGNKSRGGNSSNGSKSSSSINGGANNNSARHNSNSGHERPGAGGRARSRDPSKGMTSRAASSSSLTSIGEHQFLPAQPPVQPPSISIVSPSTPKLPSISEPGTSDYTNNSNNSNNSNNDNVASQSMLPSLPGTSNT